MATRSHGVPVRAWTVHLVVVLAMVSAVAARGDSPAHTVHSGVGRGGRRARDGRDMRQDATQASAAGYARRARRRGLGASRSTANDDRRGGHFRHPGTIAARGQASMITSSVDEVQLADAMAGVNSVPLIISAVCKGKIAGSPDSVLDSSAYSEQCSLCSPRFGECSRAYFGNPGRFCGMWLTFTTPTPQRHVACCPPNSRCALDEDGMYAACLSSSAGWVRANGSDTAPLPDVSGVTQAANAAAPDTGANTAGWPASSSTATDVGDQYTFGVESVVGSVPWLFAWYGGGTIAALCVSILWCATHPQVKAMRPSDLPALPEQDAIISFPVHRDVAFSTRATFTAVILLLAVCESVAYLFVWFSSDAPRAHSGAMVRVLVGIGAVWMLATDVDSLLVRRFIVSDALLEVSRRMRRPKTLRLSQIISVRRLEASLCGAALRAPFHYCTAYSDVVEVAYARDGCGPASSCGRPRGVGTVLVTPQHVDVFMVLLRQRAQRTKARVSRAAVVALGSAVDQTGVVSGSDDESGHDRGREDSPRLRRARRRHAPQDRPSRRTTAADDDGAGTRSPRRAGTTHHKGHRGGGGATDSASSDGHDSEASDGEGIALLGLDGGEAAMAVALPVESPRGGY